MGTSAGDGERPRLERIGLRRRTATTICRRIAFGGIYERILLDAYLATSAVVATMASEMEATMASGMVATVVVTIMEQLGQTQVGTWGSASTVTPETLEEDGSSESDVGGWRRRAKCRRCAAGWKVQAVGRRGSGHRRRWRRCLG